MVAEEVVYGGGAPDGNVGASEPLADDGSVLGLGEGVVVGVAGPGLRKLADVELVEHVGDAVVDALGAVVGVEAHDAEGEGGEEVLEDGEHEELGDADDGAGVLELSDLVDDVEDVEAPLASRSPWWTVSTWTKPGRPHGVGPAADADEDLDGADLVQGKGSQTVVPPLAEVVDVAVGDARESLEAPVAVDLVFWRRRISLVASPERRP